MTRVGIADVAASFSWAAAELFNRGLLDHCDRFVLCLECEAVVPSWHFDPDADQPSRSASTVIWVARLTDAVGRHRG